MQQEVIARLLSLKPSQRNPANTLFLAEPELHTIWRPELSSIAAFHTKQWEIDPKESGNVLTAHAGDAIVGVTGWYRMNAFEAGLRWHGVLPHARRRGHSRQMLDLVCRDMPYEIRHVFEVTRNEQSKDSFCRCGFEVITDPNVVQRVVQHAEYDIDNGGWVLRKRIN